MEVLKISKFCLESKPCQHDCVVKDENGEIVQRRLSARILRDCKLAASEERWAQHFGRQFRVSLHDQWMDRARALEYPVRHVGGGCTQ